EFPRKLIPSKIPFDVRLQEPFGTRDRNRRNACRMCWSGGDTTRRPTLHYSEEIRERRHPFQRIQSCDYSLELTVPKVDCIQTEGANQVRVIGWVLEPQRYRRHRVIRFRSISSCKSADDRSSK